MTDDKLPCGDDVITRNAPEYMETFRAIRNTIRIADRLMNKVRPCLLDERYFSTEQVMKQFYISRRALQNYRDKGIMPFVTVGGNILYPETKINEMLEKNYYKPSLKI